MDRSEVLETEFDETFVEGMRDRMYVGFLKYGPVAKSAPKIDAIEIVKLRLAKYQETGNTEYLMDAANFAMIEFMYPKHPNAHFAGPGAGGVRPVVSRSAPNNSTRGTTPRSARTTARRSPTFAEGRHMSGFWYLATTYSAHPEGIEKAFEMAARVAAALVRQGVRVFSPITHTHPVAVYGGLNPYDHSIWLPADKPLMDAAKGLIVWKSEGWKHSKGIAYEIEEFTKAGKPVVFLDESNLYNAPAELVA